MGRTLPEKSPTPQKLASTPAPQVGQASTNGTPTFVSALRLGMAYGCAPSEVTRLVPFTRSICLPDCLGLRLSSRNGAEHYGLSVLDLSRGHNRGFIGLPSAGLVSRRIWFWCHRQRLCCWWLGSFTVRAGHRLAPSRVARAQSVPSAVAARMTRAATARMTSSAKVARTKARVRI